METFAAKVTGMLRRECSHADRLSTFMGQPVITLSPDSVTELDVLQAEISGLIGRHFPNREEDIMITIRRPGLEDTGFRVWKASR